MLRLRSATRLAGKAYMDSLRDSNILVPGFTDDQQQEQLSLMQRMYLQSMTQACFRPLSQGLSAQTVIQAVGMMTTMALCSPDFRQHLGQYAQPLKDGIQRRIDAGATVRHAMAEREIAARQQLFGQVPDETRRARLIGSTDPRDHLSTKWQKRFDAVQRRERGHRDLYTPETAAMTEVALMEDAYWRMRDQGADVAQITDSYQQMRQRLHQHCRDDGVERDDVVAHARVILGQRMEFEPELRTMMLGVSHGRLVKSAPEEVVLPGSDRSQTVWTGGFEDQVGHRIPEHAMFVLRPPMSGNAHQAHLASTMASSMLHAVETGDTEGYAADLHGYRVGFAAQRQKLSTDGLPDALRARIEQTETMLASMAADGLSPEEQRRVYSNAYLDALEEVNQKHPEAEAALNASLGDDWRDTLRRAVDDPAGFYADQRTRWAHAQSRPAGPGPAPGAGPHTQAPGPQGAGPRTHTTGPSADDPEPQP